MSSSFAVYPAPETLLYVPVPSAFGALHLIWHQTTAGPRVLYVALPGEQFPPQGAPWDHTPVAVAGTCPEILELGEQLQHYLDGVPVEFDLERIALDRCGEFRRNVFLADYGIPRGQVSTYRRVARVVGGPGAARAVGQALARNPFPVVIPCHRAVRSDGRLGGYRGGLSMKRALLQLEGVEVTPSGKVAVDTFYY